MNNSKHLDWVSRGFLGIPLGQSKFKLLQYFSLTSLIAFVINLTFFGIFYRYQALKYLVTLGEETNVTLAKSLANSLWLKFAPFLTNAESLAAADLRNHPQTVLLNQVIEDQTQGLSVVKVKIYDLTGKTVFSTEETQIGKDKSKSEGFLAAKSGRVLTQLDHRQTFKAIVGDLHHRNILSSYIPIYSQDTPEKIEVVFELYSDITPLIERMKKTQRNIMLGAASILGLLYLVLFGIVRRADKIIDTQHLALEESKTKYQKQAELEAIAAKQNRAMATIIDKIRISQDIKTIFKVITLTG